MPASVRLTDDDAEEIRHAYIYDERKVLWLADKFGVSKGTIMNVLHGRYRVNENGIISTYPRARQGSEEEA